MNKLFRFLILLGIFLGLGISCASAANVVSFNPQTVEMHPGSSQSVQIVMDSAPYGLTGYNVIFFVSDPEIAEITGVSFPSWGLWPRNSPVPSSSVRIETVDLGKQVNNNDINVLLGTVTLTGKKAGTTDISILTKLITADGGSTINPVLRTGKINVTGVQTTPTITWSNPADIPYGTELGSTQLNAVASVPGTFTYTPAAGTVLSAGTQTLHVDFTPTDTANYNKASKDVTIKVLPQSASLKINDFTAKTTSGKAPLKTEFTSNVTGTNIKNWRWDFEPTGKNTYSQQAVTVTHSFTKPGTYDITLTVWDTAGQTATLTKPAYIVVSSAEMVKKPVASFSAM